MIINKKELKEKEAILYKIISKRALLPILNTYLIDKDTITATDLENTLKFTLNCEGWGDPFCIDAPKLHKLLSKVDSEFIEIIPEKEFITINADVRIKLKNEYPPIDYPMIPKIKIQNIATITLDELKEAMKYCYKACSSDETRPTIMGMNWNITKQNLIASSTDSYRIHIKKSPHIINNSQEDFNFLILGKSIYEIFKKLKGDNIIINKGKTFISFMGEDFNFTTRLISYSFPNADNLFKDTNFNYIYKIEVENLIKTIKKLIPFTNWNNPDHTAYLKFIRYHEMSLNLTNREEQINKNMSIETLKGELDFKIGLNFKYLLEAVENLKDEYIYLKCIDDLKPVWIIPEKTDFKALIMPIRTT